MKKAEGWESPVRFKELVELTELVELKELKGLKLQFTKSQLDHGTSHVVQRPIR